MVDTVGMETDLVVRFIGLGLFSATILFVMAYWLGYTRAQIRVLEAEKRIRMFNLE